MSCHQYAKNFVFELQDFHVLNTNLRCFGNEIHVNINMIGFGVVGSGYGQFEFNFIECIFSITYYLKTAVVSPCDSKFVYFCYRYWMSLKTSLCSTADTT